MSKNKPSIEDIKLNNKDDSREAITYHVASGFINLYTEDREAAYKVWSLLIEKFFKLDNAKTSINELGYDDPDFYSKASDNNIKLGTNKIAIWKSKEKALMAANSFKALKQGAEERKKANEKSNTSKDLPF